MDVLLICYVVGALISGVIFGSIAAGPSDNDPRASLATRMLRATVLAAMFPITWIALAVAVHSPPFGRWLTHGE